MKRNPKNLLRNFMGKNYYSYILITTTKKSINFISIIMRNLKIIARMVTDDNVKSFLERKLHNSFKRSIIFKQGESSILYVVK